MIYEQCKLVLQDDERFHYIGRGANLGCYSTIPKGENESAGFINFTKNLGKKGFGSVTILFHKEDTEGLEIKIDVYLPSYCDTYTFFEGFLESIEDFDCILRMLGIKKNNEE
jgi:hypothetical protein